MNPPKCDMGKSFRTPHPWDCPPLQLARLTFPLWPPGLDQGSCCCKMQNQFKKKHVPHPSYLSVCPDVEIWASSRCRHGAWPNEVVDWGETQWRVPSGKYTKNCDKSQLCFFFNWLDQLFRLGHGFKFAIPVSHYQRLHQSQMIRKKKRRDDILQNNLDDVWIIRMLK